ncbi:MAG: hypothetical protein RL685_6612 [Pseudomonadota bacterium]|jgi:hypothetical protein
MLQSSSALREPAFERRDLFPPATSHTFNANGDRGRRCETISTLDPAEPMHSQSKVNMPPSMSMPDPAASQLPLDAAYAATLPAMAALPTTELLAVNVDLMSAVTTVLAALPALRALRPQIARQLPAFDLQRFDNLEQYAHALGHVHATFRGTSPQRSNLAALAAELSTLRDRLLSAAQCLVAHELMEGRRLKECKRARGYRALASDLLMPSPCSKSTGPRSKGAPPSRPRCSSKPPTARSS